MENPIESSKKSQCKLKEFASTAAAGKRDQAVLETSSPRPLQVWFGRDYRHEAYRQTPTLLRPSQVYHYPQSINGLGEYALGQVAPDRGCLSALKCAPHRHVPRTCFDGKSFTSAASPTTMTRLDQLVRQNNP
jgi:hypothetical protein